LELEKREQEAAASNTQPALKVKSQSNCALATVLKYLIVYLDKYLNLDIFQWQVN